MRALILSCNTGGGHNAAGQALLEKFQELGVDCEMRDALLFASERASKLVCGAYVRTVTVAPKVFGLAYRAGGAISSARRKSPVYYGNIAYARALREYIEDTDVDAIVMPHLFPAECITYLRRHGGLRARAYAVSTDYVCCPFFEETEMDRFFIPHERLIPVFEARGIPRERVLVTGIPTAGRYARHTAKAVAREMLGLEEEGRMLLVMTGSMGFGHVGALVDALLERLYTTDRIVVLGGANDRLKRALRDRYAIEGRVRVEDYTDHVDLYMDACDMLFTKPGGLTTTEAAVKGVPLAHTQPIPGCETENMRFFGELDMSISAKTPQALAERAVALLDDAPALAHMAQSQRENIFPDAAERICRAVMADTGA